MKYKSIDNPVISYSASTIFLFLLLCLAMFSLVRPYDAVAQENQGRVVMDIPNYPLVFELNVGESHQIQRTYQNTKVERIVKVISIKHFTEPNYWFSGDYTPDNYSKAEIVLDISGEQVTLLHRPYQVPTVVNGIRIFVETTKEWAENAEFADLKDVEKQVRLSLSLEGEPWGPETLIFPIKEYEWRSAVYNNTWSSLVPYNLKYYHRGEDYGAIPDLLDVVAPTSGKIIATPLPDGDGASNAIIIENNDGVYFRMSHMNTETIKKGYPLGSKVAAGTVLAKTGMTWGGRKSQVNDPHFHVEMGYEFTQLASFPYMIEAYQRMYQDPILAIAGGYQFTEVNRKIELDGSRSIAGKNKTIQSYTWKLHDGKVINSINAEIAYSKPGLYTEELLVVTQEGDEDRDFVQIRVYDKSQEKRKMGFGWAFYFPVRGITVGTEVLFWNRLARTEGPVTIDFGDGSEKQTIDKELRHSYKERGNYVVELTSLDKNNNPISLKMEVKVH